MASVELRRQFWGITLRIHDIRVVGLRGATPRCGWAEETKPDEVVHTIVAVHTDEDLVGLGSVFSTANLVRAALDVLQPLYSNENALEPERVSEKLHQNTFWLGGGGAITHTISGIDIALWDILGKATNQPVGRLLGGCCRERVRPYASLLIEEPALLRERLRQLVERGFTAFKIGWGRFGRVSSAVDEAAVAAARDVIGPDRMLMVDAGASDAYWSNGYSWALRTAAMLTNYDVAWFEEPLRPDLMEDHRALRRATPLPIATGETLTKRQSFRPWIQSGAVDIVQPDVTKVGGLSEQRRIGWMAADNGVRLVPHGWNTAIGLAADLQLAAALPVTDLVEYLVGSPYIDDLRTGGWPLDEEGMLSVPTGAGLGVDIDPDAIARHTDDAYDVLVSND